MVGLNNKTTQVHHSEFHAFGNHQANIYSIYVFFKSVTILLFQLSTLVK